MIVTFLRRASVRLLPKMHYNPTSDREDIDDCRAALAGLRQLAGDHPHEPELRRELAAALCNMASRPINAGQPMLAAPFIVEVRALAQGYESDPEWQPVWKFLIQAGD